MRSELSDNAWSEPVAQVRVLVADDDKGVRAHFVAAWAHTLGVLCLFAFIVVAFPAALPPDLTTGLKKPSAEKAGPR